ncbi:hypothetical protein Hypma_002260 [Hypsizygus marmoreus]|uniref:Uncharacterized protein n=1 Tax=Hypsizygus marmoreus TaxID=39966 RepID=A0A369K091_HYPMA|nr:hypothetical protein Hypma_002260 [Hypsizygus marmoreus]
MLGVASETGDIDAELAKAAAPIASPSVMVKYDIEWSTFNRAPSRSMLARWRFRTVTGQVDSSGTAASLLLDVVAGDGIIELHNHASSASIIERGDELHVAARNADGLKLPPLAVNSLPRN